MAVVTKSDIAAFIRRKLILRSRSNSIDVFSNQQGRSARRQLNDFFGKLKPAVIRAADSGRKESVINSLKNLSVKLDLSAVPDIYEKTAIETINFIQESQPKKKVRKDAITFVFDEIDTQTIEMIQNSFFWMSADHSGVLIEEVKNVILAAFAGGIARADIPAFLEESFGLIIGKESHYFRDVSDHIISQGQNISRVIQGNKYDVKWYKVVARMDDRTTQFCRSVNSKLISANHLTKQVGNILSAKSIEEKKAAAAWPKKDGPLQGKLAGNIGSPPYHFRCRTILQPYWPEPNELKTLVIG